MHFKKLFIDTPKFVFQLYVFKLKMIFLRNDILCFGLTRGERLLKRGILIRDQEKTLFEYGGRAMLSDEFFDTAEYVYVRSLMANVM